MPHALLLSPDDQAVSAITGVLEEMSVTFERPLDGPSAAKKLTAQSFDLVLVDCENLPAAKLIFDVCRRSQTGTNPVPIAIVDGRAGLPTAFRLGAELILTKPVAKDQARTTIRTAVGRVKKDEPARTIQPIEVAPPATTHSETQAHAAAASAVSSPARSAEPAPPVAAAEPAVVHMKNAVEEIAPVPSAPRVQPPSALEMLPPRRSSDATQSAAPMKPGPQKVSDDPILADLESDSPTPVSTSYSYEPPPQKKKTSGSPVALLVLMLAGGGFYAAWMYQPAFRAVAQPQIDRVLALIGQTPIPTPAGQVVASAPVPTAPVTSEAQAPASTTSSETPGAPQPAASEPTSSASTSTSEVPATTSQSVEPEGKAANPTKSAATESSEATPDGTELQGEKTAVILSSQGAEKRLLHHSQPAYPADARREKIEGTVVLKAVVGENGKVEGVRLIEGNPTLASAAIKAVKQWTYRPYLRDGTARPFQTIVLVEFQHP